MHMLKVLSWSKLNIKCVRNTDATTDDNAGALFFWGLLPLWHRIWAFSATQMLLAQCNKHAVELRIWGAHLHAEGLDPELGRGLLQSEESDRCKMRPDMMMVEMTAQ